jgi:hypothetical protein
MAWCIYVMKIIISFRQIEICTPASSTIQADPHDITEIL